MIEYNKKDKMGFLRIFLDYNVNARIKSLWQ
jgi:hypothetical protein